MESPLYACLVASLLAPVQELRFEADRLPGGWTLSRELELDSAQVQGLEQRLGIELEGVHYQFLDVRGLALQVNLLEATSDKDAERLSGVLAANGREVFIGRKGATVVEFAKMNVLAAKSLRQAIGLGPEPDATWRASFQVACVQTLDYMEANRVSNLCAAAEGGDETADAEILSLTSDWKSGNAIRLRASGPGFEASYALEPEPIETRDEKDGTKVYRFGELPIAHGLPTLDVQATIRVAERYSPIAGIQGDNAPAPRWELAAPAKELVASLVEGHASDRERLLAVFDYVVGQIAFGGDVTGSRYGVARVLEQKHGHCWDQSDVLIAFCRAAGLRARQTAGWVPALSSGHVWAEVYLEDEGWLPVDATCRWLGTSTDYVPWFQSDDGEMPIVYVQWPKLERIE